jgi:hypothetical protein
MTEYFEQHHPGTEMAFYNSRDEPVKAKSLDDSFDWFFECERPEGKPKCKWSVVKGYHVFRHSFASNLAAAGVDQRTIDGLMGHGTETMARRYRHLFPDAKRNAVDQLFG